VNAAALRVSYLPWSLQPEDEQRFRRILVAVLLVSLVLGVVPRLLPRPQEDRGSAQALPQRFARMLLEHPIVPPLPKPEPVPEVAKDKHKDKDKPEKVPEKAEKVPETPAPDRVAQQRHEEARRKAASSGLLALQDDLADLREKPAAPELNQKLKPGPGVGAGSGPGVGAGTANGLPVRSMITSNATGGSGGINTAGFSRDAGGGGLAGRATTQVGGAGGGGLAPGSATGSANGRGQAAVQRGSDGKASRSIEEIKLVFERNKAAIYSIYSRALREEPGLEGKVVLELVIAPSGEVSELKLVSSELHAPELERKLLARIRQFDFGARDVATMRITWPLDFLPS
jgi:TonB family protein